MADKYPRCAALLVAAADTAAGELLSYWRMNVNQTELHHILFQSRRAFLLSGFA